MLLITGRWAQSKKAPASLAVLQLSQRGAGMKQAMLDRGVKTGENAENAALNAARHMPVTNVPEGAAT